METLLQYRNQSENNFLCSDFSKNIELETKKGIATIISGFSGVGKDSLIQEYLKNYSATTKAISVTSRKPRNGEVHARDYYFFDKPVVESLMQSGKLIDSFVNARGDIYGLPADELKKLEDHQTVFFNVVPESGEKIQELEPVNSLPVIIVPRSFQEWKNRLMNRNDGMDKIEKMDRIQQDLDINFKDDLNDIEKSMKNGKYHYNGKKYFLINEEGKLGESAECLEYIISAQVEKLLTLN